MTERTRGYDQETLDLLLGACKEGYYSGDNLALLRAIATCAMNDCAMPDWIATEYLKQYRKFVQFKEKELGSAFGVAHPKNTHIKALRKKREKWGYVYWRVKELHESPSKYPIDEELFAKVGAEFYISGSTARDYYYDFEKQLKPTSKNMQKLL